MNIKKDKVHMETNKSTTKNIKYFIKNCEDLQQKITASLEELLSSKPPKFFKSNYQKWEQAVSLARETLDKLNTDLLDLYSCYEILDDIIQ